MEEIRLESYIGRVGLRLDGPGLEEGFKADYWVYTVCSTINQLTV